VSERNPKPSTLVWCEFRLALGSSRDSEVRFARYQLPQAPDVGELVNLKGNPFVVTRRGWATGGDGPEDVPTALYCYLAISRTHDYRIEVYGDKRDDAWTGAHYEVRLDGLRG